MELALRHSFPMLPSIVLDPGVPLEGWLVKLSFVQRCELGRACYTFIPLPFTVQSVPVILLLQISYRLNSGECSRVLLSQPPRFPSFLYLEVKLRRASHSIHSYIILPFLIFQHLINDLPKPELSHIPERQA